MRFSCVASATHFILEQEARSENMEAIIIQVCVLLGIVVSVIIKVKAAKRGKVKIENCQKDNRDELFYKECKKMGIAAVNSVTLARMKLIANQMGISCSDEELVEKFNKERIAEKNMINAAAEKERQERIAKLIETEKIRERTTKEDINLRGRDKRIRDCERFVAKAKLDIIVNKERDKNIIRDAERMYALTAKKESSWAAHGGIASSIAGGAAGVAVAMDIQQKNAEKRAYNKELASSIAQVAAAQQIKAWENKGNPEADLKHWESELEKAKYKFVEELPQEDLLNMLSPKIVSTERSETGSISFFVSTKGASMTICDAVKATIDGTFKIRIMDGNREVGEAYFTLPYKGSSENRELESICASLPQEYKNYSFVFAPHNLFAIEL